MTNPFLEKMPNVPTDPAALRQLERHLDVGELAELSTAWLPSLPRYLVTYMNSQTAARVRSATIVTVTNQSSKPNLVTVTWFRGFTSNSAPVGVTSMSIPPDFSVDFASRNIPSPLTVVNSVCNPELVFDEGRAIVSSRLPAIGVSSRVYYTAGDGDEDLLAVTDSKVVVFEQGNHGD
jgi:hypothetical protein